LEKANGLHRFSLPMGQPMCNINPSAYCYLGIQYRWEANRKAAGDTNLHVVPPAMELMGHGAEENGGEVGEYIPKLSLV
jgi:hypothetical protein